LTKVITSASIWRFLTAEVYRQNVWAQFRVPSPRLRPTFVVVEVTRGIRSFILVRVPIMDLHPAEGMAILSAG
jgi:hypothetical protein